MPNFNVGDIVQHRLYPQSVLNPYYYIVKIEQHDFLVLFIKRLDQDDDNTVYRASLVNEELINRWKKVT